MSGSGAAAPVARDVLTWLFDRERATATLESFEKAWGGDIATRTAAREAAHLAALQPPPAAAATKIDAEVPSVAPAVQAAADVAERTQAQVGAAPAEPAPAADGAGE